MKTILIAAVAAFALTGTASAGVIPAKAKVAKETNGITLVKYKPGSNIHHPRDLPIPCPPFGCKTRVF